MKKLTEKEIATMCGVFDQRAETPHQTYERSIRRMEGLGSAAERTRSLQQWPTLGDAYRAMTESFAAMTDEERVADLEKAEANLTFLEQFGEGR